MTMAQDKANVKWGHVSAEDFILPASKAPDSAASAVIIADIGFTHFKGNKNGWFDWVYQRKTRIKILNKRGFEAANVKVFLYSRGNEQEILSDVAGSTFTIEQGQVRETKLDKNEIYSDKIKQNISASKFTLPGLSPGSIIEYSYVITSVFSYRLPEWSFQSISYPCLWSEYEVIVPMTMNYSFLKLGFYPYYIQTSKTGRENYMLTHLPRGDALGERAETMSVSVNTNDYRWVMKELPALNITRMDKYVSSPENYLEKIVFQLSQIYNGESTSDVTNSWAKATDELLKSDEFGKPLGEDIPWLHEEVVKILAGEKDMLKQAKKIYYFISQSYTCTNYNYPFFKTSIYDAFKKRSGTIGDINLLLIAMLRQAGFPANPVILSTKEYGINFPAYPIIDRFNAVICRIAIMGKYYYLDSSNPKLGFGYLASNYYNGHARIISYTDSASIYFYADSIKNQKRTNVIIINDEKGIPSGGFQSTPGYYESYAIRKQLTDLAIEQYLKGIQTAYGNDFTIQNPAIDSVDSLEIPLTIHYDFEFNNWKNQDILYINPMLFDSRVDNPFSATERKYPVEMAFPPDEVYVLNMEIPTGYAVDEMPRSAKITLNGTDGFFEYQIQKSDSEITLNCHLKLVRASFFPEEYSALRGFFATVVKKESEQIVLKKKK